MLYELNSSAIKKFLFLVGLYLHSEKVMSSGKIHTKLLFIFNENEAHSSQIVFDSKYYVKFQPASQQFQEQTEQILLI